MIGADVSRETLEVLTGAIVSRETAERLEIYVALLLRWNARINLVSRGDEAFLWQRHIADSLQLMAEIPAGCLRGIDLGSGAGFPGLVLAIATGIPFELIEADARKAAFLREAVRETAAPAIVHVARIERAKLPPAQLVTARALAPLVDLIGYAYRFIAAGGVCLFPKGAGVEAELTDAATRWNMRVERRASRLDRGGVILRISEVTRARSDPG